MARKPTPVRNVRIPDPLWSNLGKLADKRSTSITALLIEGANLLLENTKEPPKPTPSSAIVTDEFLVRLEAIETELQALTVHVSETEEQVHSEVLAHIQALDERIEALETQVQTGGRLEGQSETQNTGVQKGVPFEVHRADEIPDLEYPLSQRQLAKRLGQPYSSSLQKARDKGKNYFAEWSQDLDPDNIAWTWESPGARGKGKVARGKSLKFVPKR